MMPCPLSICLSLLVADTGYAELSQHSGQQTVAIQRDANRSADPEERAFPLLRGDPNRVVLSAMQTIRGYLRLRAGKCLVIESKDGDFLVIWPTQTLLRFVSKRLYIVSGSAPPVAIDDFVMLSGSGSGIMKLKQISGITVPKPCFVYFTFIVDPEGINLLKEK